MKLSQSLLVGLFALGAASTLNAQTKIYITGSTAFRGATIQAIGNVLSGTVTTASTNATLTSANAVTWTGGNIGGTAVTIKASFGGSVGGIDAVSNAKSWGFLPDGATGTSNADPTVSGNPNESAVPDITMSDTYQASTIFTSNKLENDVVVGVVPFRWVVSTGAASAPTPLTGLSMTPLLAQSLFVTGNLPISMLTGSTADRTTTRTVNIGGSTTTAPVQLFAIGRNPDSGTRLITFAESGIGVNTVVAQYQATSSGNTVTGHQFYPAETVLGIDYDLGNSGYSSGGTLADIMRKDSITNLGGYYAAYLGSSDATRALAAASGTGNPAVELAWNGVMYSATAVQEGKYTFWGYEHLMYDATLPTLKKTFATNVANNIIGTTAGTSGIALSAMQVTRSGDGGRIDPK